MWAKNVTQTGKLKKKKTLKHQNNELMINEYNGKIFILWLSAQLLSVK